MTSAHVEHDLDEEIHPLRAGDVIPEVMEAARQAAVEHARAMRARPAVKMQKPVRRLRNVRTRLHPELADRILGLIREGNYPQTAALANGVPVATWRDWMAKGRDAIAREEAGQKLTRSDKLWSQLVVGTETAWAEAERRLVQVVERIATGEIVSSVEERMGADGETVAARVIYFQKPHPQTATWILEKMAPDRWGRTRLEVTGADGAAIPVEVAMSAKESLALKLGLAAERMGLAPAEPSE